MRTATLGSLLATALIAVAQEPTAPPSTHIPPQPRQSWSAITLHDDDKPAFPEPPAGWGRRREGIPRGKLEMIEYDSKTVGTQRKLNVYTPPGYSPELTQHAFHFRKTHFCQFAENQRWRQACGSHRHDGDSGFLQRKLKLGFKHSPPF